MYPMNLKFYHSSSMQTNYGSLEITHITPNLLKVNHTNEGISSLFKGMHAGMQSAIST
jgi:hypothetical protein